MSEPARFLTALSQALASTGLYGPDHPATIRAVDGAHQRLLLMQAAQPAAAFTFLRDEILCGPEVVEELHGWDWNRRLADAGVERLEFTGPVGAAEFARFIDQITARLGLRPAIPPEVWQMGRPAIRFGQVAVRGSLTAPGGSETSVVWATRVPLVDIADERETMDWINREVGSGRRLPLTEADAVVRSLVGGDARRARAGAAAPAAEGVRPVHHHPRDQRRRCSRWRWRECLGVGRRQTRAIGFAGLLHDLGKVRIPLDILTKPGS